MSWTHIAAYIFVMVGVFPSFVISNDHGRVDHPISVAAISALLWPLAFALDIASILYRLPAFIRKMSSRRGAR